MDIEQFKNLLLSGKQEDAQSMLEDFMMSSVTARDRGQAMVQLASMYMEIENTANREYLAFLEEAMKDLSLLNKQYQNTSDELSLKELRKNLE